MNNQNDQAFGQLEEDIFAKAIGISSKEDRAKFLDEACRSNTHLRGRLDQWLAELDHPDEMFSDPTSVIDELGFDKRPSDHIGEFEIIREIGRGGNGDRLRSTTDVA